MIFKKLLLHLFEHMHVRVCVCVCGVHVYWELERCVYVTVCLVVGMAQWVLKLWKHVPKHSTRR